MPAIVEMKVKHKQNAFGDKELAGCQSDIFHSAKPSDCKGDLWKYSYALMRNRSLLWSF